MSGVILLIMALILGNTLATGLRERTPEIGAMRAIGFLAKHVRAISMVEGALLGLVGGVLGLLLATPMLRRKDVQPAFFERRPSGNRCSVSPSQVPVTAPESYQRAGGVRHTPPRKVN